MDAETLTFYADVEPMRMPQPGDPVLVHFTDEVDEDGEPMPPQVGDKMERFVIKTVEPAGDGTYAATYGPE